MNELVDDTIRAVLVVLSFVMLLGIGLPILFWVTFHLFFAVIGWLDRVWPMPTTWLT